MFKFFIFFIILFSNISESVATPKETVNPIKKRFILVDREIKSMTIKIGESDYSSLNDLILDKFYKHLKSNKSKISISKSNINEKTDSVLTFTIKNKSEKIETITFSDFFNYDIKELQVSLNIFIEIKDIDNKIIWRRKASKLNIHRWIEYNRQRLGNNPISDYYNIPANINLNLKQKISKKELLENTADLIIKDLTNNLLELN